jgi:predicted dehydrogenase
VLLVGGGRWGRVHAEVLRQLLPNDAELTWVSHHNVQNLERLTSGWRGGAQSRIVQNLDEALSVKCDAAFIVSAPRMHAEHASAVLRAGVPALVEKPLVFKEREAKELIDLAGRGGVLVGIGLHLLFAGYLHYFNALISGRIVRSGSIDWHDQEIEIRYGETKKLNASVPKIHDIFPHLWSILHALFPERPVELSNLKIGVRGATEIGLRLADTEIHARIDRRARQRRRLVALSFADGGTAELDFTREPASITADGQPCDINREWQCLPSPLTVEARSFLSALDDSRLAATWPGRAALVLDSVRLAEEIATMLSNFEVAALARGLADGGIADADASALFEDNVAPELAGFGFHGDAAAAEIASAYAALRSGGPGAITGNGVLERSGFIQKIRAAIS